MRVDRLRLRNFKCYGDADLSLDRGVSVVHGVNGSGKSTLLEAVFFALYGSKALDDRTLDDVITIGEEDAAVECWFTHGGNAYHVQRELKLRGERATTTTCVLETPEETIDGARDVRRAVTELLRMDADAFVNCAYVRQGEVNKLIHASPSERQDVIDDLLQLGALEEYRERASDARLGVEDVRREVSGQARNLSEQIEAKAEKGLHDRLNRLESRRTEVSDEIERFQEQREQARQTLEAAIDVLERHEEIREEIQSLDDEIEELRSKITETERERGDAGERIKSLRSRRESLAEERQELLTDVDLDGQSVPDRIETLETRDEQLRDELEAVRVAITEQQSEIEQLRSDADQRKDQAGAARSAASELDEKLSADEEAIESSEAKLAELESELDAERATFDDAPVALGEADDHREELAAERETLRETISELSAEIKSVENAIDEGERLLDEGKCPECGQSVADSPHVDVLDERREELASLEDRLAGLETERDKLDERIERAETLVDAEAQVERLTERRTDVEQLLSQRRETVADRRRQRDRRLEEAETEEAEAEDSRDRAAELDEEVTTLRGELGAINADRSQLKERLKTLRRVTEIDTERSELETEVEGLRDRRQDWETLNDERREQLSAKRDRKADLESRFDDDKIEAARSDRDQAEAYIEKVDEKISQLEETRDELQNAIGAVENELEELESLRNQYETVERRTDRLDSLYDEAETLQETYGDLRAELRQRNVETLERLLNETFDLVYQNDSYAGIDLDGEYRLTVYQKDGEPLEPEQLSGGERALFNLSLRCAIYRLLAEGVDGAAPMPPLILDEPTVFLDAGHVAQLVSLVESMRDMGVEQIVVVSHDDELVGAADDLIHVHKDPTSNRSRLERREAAGLDPIELD